MGTVGYSRVQLSRFFYSAYFYLFSIVQWKMQNSAILIFAVEWILQLNGNSVLTGWQFLCATSLLVLHRKMERRRNTMQKIAFISFIFDCRWCIFTDNSDFPFFFCAADFYRVNICMCVGLSLMANQIEIFNTIQLFIHSRMRMGWRMAS